MRRIRGQVRRLVDDDVIEIDDFNNSTQVNRQHTITKPKDNPHREATTTKYDHSRDSEVRSQSETGTDCQTGRPSEGGGDSTFLIGESRAKVTKSTKCWLAGNRRPTMRAKRGHGWQTYSAIDGAAFAVPM